MPRPILLFTGPWADLPLEALAAKAASWGYDGFELCCWGDHLEVQRGLSDDGYCPARLDLLARHDLQVPVIANHKVGQAVCDPIDRRHQALLPDYVWGDGKPAGVQQRAAEEMMATFRLAEKLGAGVVSGFTGSPIWSYVAGYPAPQPEVDRRRHEAVRQAVAPDPRRGPRERRALRLRGAPRPAGVRPVLGRTGARRPRRPRGVRLHRSTRATCTGRAWTRSSSCAGSPTASIMST